MGRRKSKIANYSEMFKIGDKVDIRLIYSPNTDGETGVVESINSTTMNIKFKNQSLVSFSRITGRELGFSNENYNGNQRVAIRLFHMADAVGIL